VKFLYLFMIALLLALPAGANEAPTEAEREITYLINEVRDSGQTFVRNGTPYPAAEAADHLAMKYNRVKDHIATAEDFIEKVASKSSVTGQPYIIEGNDGSEVLANAWLHEELDRMRSETPQSESTK